MSIQLLLVRHGMAEELSSEICDFDRRLTIAGVKQLEKTIWRLRPFQRPSEDTIVLTSPRIRAVQTAAVVASVFHTDDVRQRVFVDDGCFSELVDFLHALSQQEDHTVFVVGHQPTLGYWSNLLCGSSLPFKKGAAASFTVQGLEIENTQLDWFYQPEDMLSLRDRGSVDERTESYAVVLSRQLKGLLAILKSFDQDAGDAETIHQVRVMSRKAVAALLLYRPILRKPVFSDTKRTLKQVTKIFSSLRDIDTLIDSYTLYASESSSRTKANREIRERLAEIRQEEESSAREKMASGRLLRRIESVSSKKMIVDTFFASNPRGMMPFDDKANLEKQRMKLIRAAGEVDLDNAKATHAFRVSARLLRYMLELSGDMEASDMRIRGMSLESIQHQFGRLCETRRGIRILTSSVISEPKRRSGGKESFAGYLTRMEDEAKRELYDNFLV